MVAEASPEHLARLVRQMLGPGVCAGYACPADEGCVDLMPDEAAATVGMVPARRREFAAGRRAVRMAARSGGLPPFAVPMGHDRAPVWPERVIGSIAHSDRVCVAVVGQRTRLVSVGIDVEPATPLPDAIGDEICGRADRAANLPARSELGDLFTLVVFAAKEAAYKSQYPLTGALIGFDALSIRLDVPGGNFVAQFESAVGAFPAGEVIRGRFAIARDHVLTAAWVTAAQWAGVAEREVRAAHG